MSLLAAFMVPHPPMIVPDIGRGGEKQVAETTKAYEQAAAEIAALRPETILITSPHSVMYSDYFHLSPGTEAKGSFADFRAPQVSFREDYDEELTDQICALAAERDFPAGTLGERDRRLDHGTMVPLWFIRRQYSGGRIVRIGLSGLPLADHYRLGMMIREAVDMLDRRAVLVASGDLSHKLQDYGPYGYAPEGPEYDRRIMDVCGRAAFGELFDFSEAFCERAAECGHRSFVVMAGAFDGENVEAKVLSHQDVTGVGYGVCTFYPKGGAEDRHFLTEYLRRQETDLEEKKEKSDAWVSLARQTIETYIRTGQTLCLPGKEGGRTLFGRKAAAESGRPVYDGELPPEMLEKQAGAFVSLHKHGRLRGCIGTTGPTTSCVAEEIIQNAVSAATRDNRFDPVTEDELKWLEINVDVLGEPEVISSPAELDVKRYGVIVSSGFRRGLLLPDLEGVDTVEQQIDIARKKGGIGPGEPVTLERFEVVRHV